MADETAIGGNDVRFRATAWTVVRSAQEGSRDALDRLITTYWKPVYFFVRRRGRDVEAAKDLTQSFFGTLLERDTIKAIDPERGSFRNYLLGALTHFLSDEHDRASARKRGGDFNFARAEADLVSAEPTPEEAFRSAWAREILARAMARLRLETAPEDLALLAGAPRPELSVTDRKNRLFRLRGRLKECLRAEIEPSVAGPGEMESEIRELFNSL